ncbi:hypothetical protein RW25_28800 [Bacillus sp. L_1B0_8]|nr:hypothetical protein RW25_28800 [Bacillus sp. L_1B0_8]KIQ83002.1 hypothetical protein RT27_23385 [Bacillus sp. L_1B0_5]KXY70195.1 hypothetical protein AT270_07995 [Bacillus cereus]
MKKNSTIIIIFLLLYLFISGIGDVINGKTGMYDYIWIVVVAFAIVYSLHTLYSLYSNKGK